MNHPWEDAQWAITRRFEGRDAESVEQDLRAALAERGFGILTEIDVQKTLRKKLDIETRPYRILGACNPTLAHTALSAVPAVGLFLPCNVVVTEDEDGAVRVGVINPHSMVAPMGPQPGMDALMDEAAALLKGALDSVPSAS